MGKEFLYDIVRKRLEQEILTQKKAGEFLPSVAELCARFGASAITVNRVLRELAEEGRLERIKHCGTRVVWMPGAVGLAPVGKRRIRILAAHPQRWLVMHVMERKLVDFCRYRPEYELQCEYASRDEQIERLLHNDYDFVFADSGQVKLMMHFAVLREKLLALDQLPGLHFNPTDFVPAAVRLGCAPDGRQYGLVLTAGPDLQLIDLASGVPGIDHLSPYWNVWLSQLCKLRQGTAPMLSLPLDLRYLEPIFRMHGVPLFDPEMRQCLLDTAPVRTLLEELVHYLHREKLGLLSGKAPGLGDLAGGREMPRSQIPVMIVSMISLQPGRGSSHFRMRPLPQARTRAAWLFWEGVLVGRQCDPVLAAELLNYFQNATVQSSLLGCTGLPARRDMQQLALMSYEPDFPGITEAFTKGMEAADNPYAIPYPALKVLNDYFRQVLCGRKPLREGLRERVRDINSILRQGEAALRAVR